MENASKALLMAASVLIGLLILSLGIYLFISFGNTSRELHKQNDTQKIEQFNSQFTSYEGKDDITIHDVITIANLATENNIYYELKRSEANVNNNYIIVRLGTEPIEGQYESDVTTLKNKLIDLRKKYNNLINTENKNMVYKTIDGESILSLPNYNCKVDISPVTNRVYQVTFTKK